MKNQSKQKPALPTIPDANHLLTVANELYIGNAQQAQIAKDKLIQVAFAYALLPTSNREEVELLYLLYQLLDNIQDEL
jgi:hypothetical protein